MKFSAPQGEVLEMITLGSSNIEEGMNTVKDYYNISETVKKQLQDFIFSIAMAYRNNSFHNFEHACHVYYGSQKAVATGDQTA
jgi:hypothetical protein